jgi:hypothetical protein
MSGDDLVSSLQASFGSRHPTDGDTLIPLNHAHLTGSLIRHSPTLLQLLCAQVVPQLAHELQETPEGGFGRHFRSQELEVVSGEGSHL